ncbi:hypothetical protein A2318_02560 [Candidatus Uhrbacteria bacterium RIFOXYB2_FULL_45_11]|uniref:Uncharacterized protein n=1 Tax=Candidatus Uhrbacteria bacterium RIFOXYB2_FULL_45_11 TaxID=1802421 RepID=A0A1F7WAD1_9BACT|nr:MAG: hypothetical protein A2318_02560 [Candidatus Uhrbacteria bacterium RIFOXYB2_FULL_45_11]
MNRRNFGFALFLLVFIAIGCARPQQEVTEERVPTADTVATDIAEPPAAPTPTDLEKEDPIHEKCLTLGTGIRDGRWFRLICEVSISYEDRDETITARTCYVIVKHSRVLDVETPLTEYEVDCSKYDAFKTALAKKK